LRSCCYLQPLAGAFYAAERPDGWGSRLEDLLMLDVNRLSFEVAGIHETISPKLFGRLVEGPSRGIWRWLTLQYIRVVLVTAAAAA
jgi:hypothetical protein